MTGLYDVPRLYDLISPSLAGDDPELAWWRDACALGGATAGHGEVLELGAGSGRVAVPLAQAGLRVTALDLSPAMIARGRERAEAAGVAGAITWIEGDMTAFELGRRFEAILVAYNTFLHLHTRAQHAATFAAIRRHLAPGGVLALSVVSPDPHTLGRGPYHRLVVAPPVLDPVEGAVLTVEETIQYDHATQCTLGQFHFTYPGRPDFLVVPVDLRMIYPAELEALVDCHGFDIVRRHGDWDGSQFDSQSLIQNLACRAR